MYLVQFTYMYHTNQLNVGEYTIDHRWMAWVRFLGVIKIRLPNIEQIFNIYLILFQVMPLCHNA